MDYKRCIMRRTARQYMTLILAGICAGMMVSSFALSQEPIACPDVTGLFAAFDVVSVKPADPAGPHGLRDLPDGFDGTATVEGLLRTFYPFPSGIANDDLLTVAKSGPKLKQATEPGPAMSGDVT